MYKTKLHKIVISIILIVLHFGDNLFAQCNPEFQLPPSNTCELSEMISTACDMDSLCGDMQPGSWGGEAAFCGGGFSLQNPHWYSFIAASNVIEIHIALSDCIGGNGTVQWALFDNCSNLINALICNGSGTGSGSDIVIFYPDAIPGKLYYIVLDGSSGTTCHYEFYNNSGITTSDVGEILDENLIGNPFICPQNTSQFSFGGYEHGTSYVWSLDGIIQDTTLYPNLTLNVPDLDEGAYPLCVKVTNGCDSIGKEICWDVQVNYSLTEDVTISICQGDSLLYQNNYYKVGEYFVFDLNDEDCIDFVNLTVIEYLTTSDDTVNVSLCPGENSFMYNGNNYEVNILYQNVVFENESRCKYTANLLVTNIVSNLFISSTLDTIACSGPMDAILTLEGDIISSTDLISQTYKWKKYPYNIVGTNQTYETLFPGEYLLEVTSTFKIPDELVDVIPNTTCITNLKYVIHDSENIFSQAGVEIITQNPSAGSYSLGAYPEISWADYIWSVPPGVSYTEVNYGKINLKFSEPGIYEICVYMVDMCSVSEEKCIEINVPTLHNSNAVFSQSISLRQNPVNDELIFEIRDLNEKDLSILITNMNGMHIKSENMKYKGILHNIDVQTLIAGVYIYQIQNRNGDIKIGKFVKL